MLDANDALVRILGYPSRESLMEVNVREMYVDPAGPPRVAGLHGGRERSVGAQLRARLRRFDGR